MEELLARHRKEQRDLQSKITQKKKASSKKTRKGINDECIQLEQELKERQQQEISTLNGGTAGDGTIQEDGTVPDDEDEEQTNGVTEALSSVSISNSDSNPPDSETQPLNQQSRKPTRQKARLARRAAEQADLAAKASEEAESLPDLRAKERESMLTAFKARGLQEKEIRADGHCLYSAVADQLALQDIGLRPHIMPKNIGEEEKGQEEPYRTVRRTAAEYIRSNKEAFEPFLEEPLEEYVRKVEETGEWGGQLELLALAKAYGVKISVLDGNGSVHEIGGNGEKEEETRIWLAYYRHNFGLGEHYNSLRKG